jgi:hypothetical protein
VINEIEELPVEVDMALAMITTIVEVEEEAVAGLPMIRITIRTVQAHQEVEDRLHPVVGIGEMEEEIAVEEGKVNLEFRCWCGMLLHMSRRKIFKWPLDGLETFVMCTYLETTILSDQRALPLSSMAISKKHVRHAMRCIGFGSRVVNWRSYSPKNGAKPLTK